MNNRIYSYLKEEDESMEVKYKLDIIQNFEFVGRAHALALSQETLLTSSPKVMQFACASSNFVIYLFESGLKEQPEEKVGILCSVLFVFT